MKIFYLMYKVHPKSIYSTSPFPYGMPNSKLNNIILLPQNSSQYTLLWICKHSFLWDSEYFLWVVFSLSCIFSKLLYSLWVVVFSLSCCILSELLLKALNYLLWNSLRQTIFPSSVLTFCDVTSTYCCCHGDDWRLEALVTEGIRARLLWFVKCFYLEIKKLCEFLIVTLLNYFYGLRVSVFSWKKKYSSHLFILEIDFHYHFGERF